MTAKQIIFLIIIFGAVVVAVWNFAKWHNKNMKEADDFPSCLTDEEAEFIDKYNREMRNRNF